MGRKEKEGETKQKIKQVLRHLRNQGNLTLKQEKFCSDACISRFLNAKGGNVKKAAKQLRSCLAWRDNIAIDQLIADEFAAEISEGAAYVAGLDDESRPVLVIRLKQEYQKLHSQKLLELSPSLSLSLSYTRTRTQLLMYIRLLVFTMEVAVALMPRDVQQFVLLLDAGGCFKSASACLNIVVSTFNVLGDYYPGRLGRAFIIDPPSLFSYLWKGFRPFVDSASAVSVLSLVDARAAAAAEDGRDPAFSFSRTASHRYDTTPRLGSSFRFTFAVPPHDPLKPWHLTLAEPNNNRSSEKGGSVDEKPRGLAQTGPENRFEPRSLDPLLVSPLNARSFSFASAAARTPRSRPTPDRLSLPSTPWSGRSRTASPSPFLGVPAIFRRDSGGRSERTVDAFRRWAHFYWAPYDEMSYRARMRPPLGGLISIISPHLKRRVSPHLN
ncbi:CRAL-TRIO domain-containing protein C23B6-04c [Nymphaea thermarum]|nr:CRAL-TRIO domain-containing protein C23B6-04c [Nymphaea thermarum]